MGRERKGYNLIVYDKWTKRGGQLAKVLQHRRRDEKERNTAASYSLKSG